MPVLSAKNNPPSKPFDCSILEKEGTWWIAKVKPRQEKVFAFDLLEQETDYYLPFFEKRTSRSDGKFRKSYLVLFPTYVPFITEDPYTFLKQNRVVTILPVQAQKRFKEQLHQICRARNAGFQIEPVTEMNYKVGDSVRIASGLLAGISGNITQIQNGLVLILSVDGLGHIKINYSSIVINNQVN